MVWSPLSNLLLYGPPRASMPPAGGGAHRAGQRLVAFGKQEPLGELKVAWLYSQHMLTAV